jgi:anti-sigma factor (TIGR02949 family)
MSDVDCRAAEQRLQAYLDRALEARDAAEVERHLADCGYCRERYEFEARLRDRVRSCCAAPDGFVERLRVRLQGYVE